MISPKRTCDPRMSSEAAMSSVPRTVASLELATILFILNGDRCLQKRPLFPCSPEDILTAERRQRSLVSVTPSVRRPSSEEDHFHAILQANFPLLDGVWHCQCHGWLVGWLVRCSTTVVLHSRRICGPRSRTGGRASERARGARARAPVKKKREEMCMCIRGLREERGEGRSGVEWEEKRTAQGSGRRRGGGRWVCLRGKLLDLGSGS